MRIVRAMGAGLLLTAAIPAPAYADVAGRYETVDDDVFMKMEMTLEVDDQGNMRMQQGGAPSYYLLLDGEMYGVSRQAGDASVVRLSDLALIARETFDQMGVSGAFAEAEDSEPIKFSEMGPQTVGGRSGTAYGIVSEDSDKPGWGSLVISDDPRLAPLGKAMADAQKSQVKGMGSLGVMLRNLSGNMQNVLRSGAPLRWMRIELTDVSFDKIPADRFVLPSEPISLEELRAASQPASPPPTLPPHED